MAPGANGDYRSHDSLCSEFSVDILRKKEYCQDTHRDCGDLQKDGMHREYIKGKHIRISGIFNGNGSNGKVPVMGLVSKSFTDREPGEVSSEDNSGIKDQIKGSEEKDAASSDRKRKFLPIEGVRIDKICNAVRPKFLNKELSISLQSDHSLPQKCFNPFSAKRIRKPEDLSTSTDHNASIYSMHGVPLDNDDFDEQMEEDYVPESALYLSRWADANDFPEDAKDLSDMNILPNKMKNNFLSPTQGINSDFGEVPLREGSQGSSSVSGELSKESCLESMEDGKCEEISNGAESDSSLEGCSVRSLDLMEPPCSSISMRQGCRTVDEFEKLNKINEGTYGIVYRARDKKTGEIVALKKVKMEKEREGFPLTSLREINILLSLHHPSIVGVKEVVLGRDLDSVFTVMEYMEHDLKGLMETMKKPFHMSEVKCLMLQLLAGVKHLHDNWVLHRDLKTSNLLFNNHGELKICDFGLSRQYSSPLKPYTKLVVTMWYRAPELLLGAKEYSTAIDMWSVGCILAELLTKQPIFPGKNELDQLDKIFKILGTPDVKIWPGFPSLPGATVNFAKKPFRLREKFPRMSATSFVGHSFLSDVGFDLLTKLLTHDPEKRITADDALNHPWFRESPLPTTKDFMPAFPARHRQDSHQQRILKSPDLLEQLTQKDSQ